MLMIINRPVVNELKKYLKPRNCVTFLSLVFSLGRKMSSERFIYCLILGLALSRFVDCRKFDINKLNVTALHKPQVSAAGISRAGFQPFWDPDFCDDWQDLDAFPHPDSCAEYLICWQGELWEQECPPGMLFDPWGAFCDDEEYVVCLDDLPEGPWPDDMCPPPGSNEVRFLPSLYCDEFYICINGQPVLLQCRPGQHWNVYEEFCDDPINAGCDVRQFSHAFYW